MSPFLSRAKSESMNLYDIDLVTIDGKQQKMDDYRRKTLLIVNVASECGFTPQYQGLQALYDKFVDRGFVVLGFPCNQFGQQEPGGEAEIERFCTRNYGVTFPMFAKIDVKRHECAPALQIPQVGKAWDSRHRGDQVEFYEIPRGLRRHGTETLRPERQA